MNIDIVITRKIKNGLFFMVKKTIALFIFTSGVYASAAQLPPDFVYLKDVDPSILQEIRYAGDHNFIGRPIKGYKAKECILTKKAAFALRDVQTELRQSGLSLKVYDCYRPQEAVNDFIAWSKIPSEHSMKAEFYPEVDKTEFFKLGYVAEKSGHTRGSTVDLTIVSVPAKPETTYHKGQKLVACFMPYTVRYQDNSIDFGTGFDCFDSRAHSDSRDISLVAFQNRALLRAVMQKYQFVQLPEEWWHFTLKDEPYPDTYFNFPVVGS